MQDLLEVDSIVKSFDLKQVLTDVNLKCSKGDIIGLVGRNGIGKSTLLKIIFGVLNANNKYIRINNKVIEKPFLSKELIKYLPQSGFLPLNLTVQQVVGLYFKKEDKSVFLDDEILNKLLNTKISHLSGGEGRYLEIKMLLKSNAKFILLDEPFNGVAPLLIESIKKMIKNESFNKGIILTDHDYSNVLSIANKLYLMFDGGLKEIKDKQELKDWGYLLELK
jgi:lipopolysaccharide export system ATP-binding protein